MSAQTALTSRVLANRIATARVVELIDMGAQINPAMEVLRLERILEPASDEQALRTLEKLYRQFAVTPPSDPEDRRELNRGYLLAMQGYPIWAIIDAGVAFVRGQVEGHNPDFMPKPAMVGREISRRVDSWRMKLGRAQKQADERRQLDSEAEGYGPLPADLRAHGDAVAARLRASAAAKRQDGFSYIPAYVDPNPITPEALEAAGIPDAPNRDGHLQKAPRPDHFEALRKTA